MSVEPAIGMSEILSREQAEIEAEDTLVLDVRMGRGFVVWLNGSTVNAQPCDEEGTVVPGSGVIECADGAVNDPNWSHYLLTNDGAETAYACSV